MARIKPNNELGQLIKATIPKDYRTISEFAQAIGVDEKTVRVWIRADPAKADIRPASCKALQAVFNKMTVEAIQQAIRTGIEPLHATSLPETRREETAIFLGAPPSNRTSASRRASWCWSKNGIPVDVIPGPHIFQFGLGGIVFREHTEDGNLIRLLLDTEGQKLPVDLVPSILNDIELNAGVSTHTREFIRRRYLEIQGSNTYPRLRAVQVTPFTADHGAVEYRLSLEAEKSSYIIGALRELFAYPPGTSRTFDTHFADKNIANLGVEILLTSASSTSQHTGIRRRPDPSRRIAMQRRSREPYTYKLAWDVSASGFIDCLAHRNPEGTLSLVTAAMKELEQEASIPPFSLPNEEHFEFFGIMHVRETGHTDVVGQCLIDDAKFDAWYKGGALEIKSRFVDRIEVINLTPRSFRLFLTASEINRYWNPTGFLTVVAALRRAGFEPGDIWSEIEPTLPQLHFAAHR